MFGLKSGVISVLLLGLFIFIDSLGALWLHWKRKISDWQHNFCSSFKKKKWLKDKHCMGGRGEAIMFFWQVYNKSASSQYFHVRNLWSAALWCLNVVRTGFSAPHLCLFIVCKFSTQSEEFPLIKTAKIEESTFSTRNTHSWLLEWQKPLSVMAASHSAPPVCILIKITLKDTVWISHFILYGAPVCGCCY